MPRQYLEWQLHNQSYALAVEYCVDVQRKLAVVEIPHSEEWIQGIVNWRGDIVTVMDLSVLFTRGQKSIDMPPIIMRLQYKGEVIAIGVDEIYEVLDVEEAQIQSSDKFLSVQEARYITSVIQKEQKLLLVPDLKKIFSI